MFVTAAEVQEMTGYSVNDAAIRRSQAIIEVACGKTEGMVNPITQASDLAWLKYAVSWQCAYMENEPAKIYEQANVESMSQQGFKIVFGDKAYYLSPLAAKALSRLSWNKSRSVKSKGWLGNRDRVPYWWEW